MDAIGILIQATETTICFTGPQYSNRFHHSRFYYAIAFICDSFPFLCFQKITFNFIYVAKEMVNIVGLIICFCFERSRKVLVVNKKTQLPVLWIEEEH